MCGVHYTGPRLGDGPIFEVSVSQLHVKECPDELPTEPSSIAAAAIIDFSFIQARLPIKREDGWLSG
jgi:hypothetical protein